MALSRYAAVMTALAVLGVFYFVSRSVSLAAEPKPGLALPTQDLGSIEVLDQNNDPIFNLLLLVDTSDPLFPVGQAVTIKIRAKGVDTITVTRVFFLDAMQNELGTPGITLSPSPVGQILRPGDPPFAMTVTPGGVFVRPPNVIVFPINGGAIQFQGIIVRGLLDVVTETNLTINITSAPALTVPTLSEWGRIIMALLIVATGLSFMVMREPDPVFTTSIEGTSRFPMQARRVFDRSLLTKWLRFSLAVFTVTLIASRIYDAISILDVIGSTICACIGSYIAHLLIRCRR